VQRGGVKFHPRECKRASGSAKSYARPPRRPQRCRDSRKVRNPRRAGDPERGDAGPPAPEHLETQAGRDVNPAQRVLGDRARTTTRARGREERELWRGEAQAGIGAASRKGRHERARRRDQGPEGGAVRPAPPGSEANRRA
jgi:hypothetical protein